MLIAKNHTKKLVIQEPYKYMLNPMILGILLIVLGESLIFNSFSILIFSIIFNIANLLYIPLVEEKGLIERFGQVYIEYKSSLRGGIPSLKLYIQKQKNNNFLAN